MTTQPTPEQLAKWTQEFLLEQPAIYTRDNPRFIHDAELKGYLRAKQETEQAMKLAKFGAMVCSANKIIELPAMAEKCGIYKNGKIAPNIEATIKELLK